MSYNYVDKADLVYTLGKIKTFIDSYLAGKVDAVSGKQLSTEDFTTALKTKLEGLYQVVVDSALDSTSENALQNKVIKSALDDKVDKVTGKQLSTEDFTTVLKTKLEGLYQVVVDSAFDLTSENAIQNKVVKAALDDKVDKVSGKQLSTEDFTTVLKTKLEGLYQVIVDSALDATSENAVQNKVVKAALDLKAPLASPAFTGLPTAPTATAGDNSTQVATTAFVQGEITSAIGDVVAREFRVVQTLPSEGDSKYIYLVPKSTAQTRNIYDEYVWVVESSVGSWEKIGDTAIDLSGYVQTTDMIAVTTSEIDTMFTNW